MQKTQVLKLNSSKDDVQDFFDKMKNKFLLQQKKIGSSQNFDITMIVKHESKQGLRRQPKHGDTQNVQTMKSILTQNNRKQSNQNPKEKKQKVKIYDEDMNIQSRMLDKDISFDSIVVKQNLLTKQKIPSPKVLREANKIPSINAIFYFNKKKEQMVQNSLKGKGKSVFQISYDSNKCKQSNLQEQSGGSKSDQISEDNETQQLEQQQLKRQVTRKQIDIFPNIQINRAVSEKMLSSNRLTFGQRKLQVKIGKKRCSISNQNLLSPKMHKKIQDVQFISNKRTIDDLKNRANLGKPTHNKQKEALDQQDHIKQSLGQQKSEREVGNKGFLSLRVRDSNGQQSGGSQECFKVVQKRQKSSSRNSSLKKSHFQGEVSVKENKKSASFNNQGKGQTTPATSYLNRLSEYSSADFPLQPQLSVQQKSSEQSDGQDQLEQQQDSIYVIENKLNECLKLLEKNQLVQLEDFLYDYKDKYFSLLNSRVQIKWRLMMAHCKENKREFERAAVNYNNVIEIAKENPKSLIIEPAEVYHRIAVCYSEIGQWNKGILAFTQALNRYKRCKNATKYSQTMNNLGTLYLQAQSISLAQKCFIQSYNLKKSLHGGNSTKLLTSLFNIFQCNILMKNYDQAEKVVKVIDDQIISRILLTESNQTLYLGGLYRRWGKMEFLKGNVVKAQQYYLRAFDKLSFKYPYCMEFGELMSCLGLLTLQQKKFKEAKQYYDKAIMLLNFYCSKGSKTILTLKRNLEYAVKMIKQQKQGWSSNRLQILANN